MIDLQESEAVAWICIEHADGEFRREEEREEMEFEPMKKDGMGEHVRSRETMSCHLVPTTSPNGILSGGD